MQTQKNKAFQIWVKRLNAKAGDDDDKKDVNKSPKKIELISISNVPATTTSTTTAAKTTTKKRIPQNMKQKFKGSGQKRSST